MCINRGGAQIEGETRIEEWWERYGSTHLNSITFEIKVGIIVKIVPEGESYICSGNAVIALVFPCVGLFFAFLLHLFSDVRARSGCG